MSYTREQLRGLSAGVAELYGKPHLGAEYTGNTATRYIRTEKRCVYCHRRPSSNAHHVAPRSRGHTFKLVTPRGTWELRSALFALCGSGTMGCHGGFHTGRLKATWKWDSQEAEDAWWSGELLSEYEPHSQELYNFGEWLIENTIYQCTTELRGGDVVYVPYVRPA